MLDLAIAAFFKHKNEQDQKNLFFSFFKKRFLVASLSDTRSIQDSSQQSERVGDERITSLLPFIFDDVEAKNWRLYNDHLDAKIVITFFKEYFKHWDDGEEAGPPDVRILFSCQVQRKDDLLEDV